MRGLHPAGELSRRRYWPGTHIVTRGLDHASRIYPTCALKFPNSGKPEFGWSIFFARRMDGRVISAFTRVFRRAMPGHDEMAHHVWGKFFDYILTTLLTTYRAYASPSAASFIEGVF